MDAFRRHVGTGKEINKNIYLPIIKHLDCFEQKFLSVQSWTKYL